MLVINTPNKSQEMDGSAASQAWSFDDMESPNRIENMRISATAGLTADCLSHRSITYAGHSESSSDESASDEPLIKCLLGHLWG